MQTQLRARMLADATISGLVSTRIDWNIRPQARALPAIVLTLISDNRDQTMVGIDTTQGPLVQIDCFAETYAAMTALRDAVISLIVTSATQGAVRFMAAQNISTIDRLEKTDTGVVHYSTIRANIWHTIP